MDVKRTTFDPANLMALGIFGLSLVYLLLPWAVRIWWVLCGYVFQGVFIALTTQGCQAYIRTVRHNSKPHWSQQMLIACLIGCVVTPLIGFPFLRTSVPSVDLDSLSSFIPTFHHNTTIPSPLIDAVRLSRKPRAVDSVEQQLTTLTSTSLNATENSTEAPTVIEHTSLSTKLPNTTTTVNTITTTPSGKPIIPTKPSISDAKHLNQDSSSADGSQTASKMKQLGEERRMDSIAHAPDSVPAETPISVPVVSEPETFDNKSAGSSSAATALANSTKNESQILSSPPTIVSPQNNATLTPNKLNSTTPALGHPNIDLQADEQKASSKTVTTTTSKPIVTTTQIVVPTPLVIHVPNKTVNNTTTTTTTTEAPSSTTLSTTHHKHIAEHRSRASITHQLYFTNPLLPIQKLYLFVSFLGVLIWLMVLPFTGWCRSTQRSPRSSTTGQLDAVRLHRRRRPRGCDVQPQDSQNALAEHERLISSDDQRSTDSESDDPHYERNQMENFTSAVLEPLPTTAHSGNREVHPNPDLPHWLTTPQWPALYWPTDAWLLLAEFFHVGLETTYGAFIHGFTIRYLLWTPAMSFLVLSLFWLGELFGRLIYVFLIKFKSTDVRLGRQTDLPRGQNEDLCERRDANCSRESSFSAESSGYTRWLFPLIRLFGAMLCALSASVLLRLSLSSTARFPVQPLSMNTSPQHNYLAWLAGTLLIGFGVGISASAVGSVIATPHTVTAHRLQLAGHLGPLLVPALVAYAHHLAVSVWHCTTVFTGSILFLSGLLCISLFIDGLLRVLVERDHGKGHESTNHHHHQLRSVFDPKSDEPTHPSSPVTLHGVDE